MTRRQLTEMLFETFNVPRFQFFSDAVCAAVAAGRSTALVVHFGTYFTSIVPVFEGIDLPYAALKAEMGGDDVTLELTKLINAERGPYWFVEKQTVKNIKETLAFVSLDFDADLQDAVRFFVFRLLFPTSHAFLCHAELGTV
jgi:actin-related protein